MVAGNLIAIVFLVAVRYALIRGARPLRKYLDDGPWGDALAYFMQIQYYRKYTGAELDPRCLFRGKSLHTPSFYHKLVLRSFSDEMLWARPWLPNLLLYALGAGAFIWLASPLIAQQGAYAVAGLVLLFAAQADNSRFDDQSVHFLTIQPRLLGALALSLNALIFALMPSAAIAVIVGSLAVTVAINTSVFSRQAAYFVLPLAALLAWNPIPAINLAIATALSLLVNREEFVDSFRAHWRYAKWYFNNFYQPRPGSGLIHRLRRCFAPPIRFLPRYADTFSAAVLLLLLAKQGDDPFAARALAMLGAALIICGITATRKFASLGECWRYLSFTCYFLTPIAIVYALPRLAVPAGAAYTLAAAALSFNLYCTLRGGRGDLSNPIREISALLRQAFDGRTPPTVWWSNHYRYGSIPVAMGCGESTFEIQGTDLSAEAMASLFVKYPYLHCNAAFFDTHRVSHLLISRAEWPQESYGPVDAVIAAHTVLAENPNFIILARSPARA